MLVLLAVLPIAVISILMIAYLWPSSRAMPVGWALTVLIAALAWDMPPDWLAAATIAGVINAVDILIIVFGALLILQLMARSGGIAGISRAMAAVSADRRVQIVIIAWLMGSFLEGAAGFGTPAAVAAPLLVGMGFPPLIAATTTLIADSAAVTFGAVGVPIWGGFAAVRDLAGFPVMHQGTQISFARFLHDIGAQSALLHFLVGSFIPLALAALMTKVAEGSFRRGLEVWKLTLFAGFLFTVPQLLIAVFVGPELPALLGSLAALPVFIAVVSRGLFVPRDRWDFPERGRWPAHWEGQLKAGGGTERAIHVPGPLFSWLPYILVGLILLAGRLEFLGLTPLLKSWEVSWDGILGTGISRGITPFYNPGIFPFLFVALLIPPLHGMGGKAAARAWKDTFHMIGHAAIALFFALAMVYILMNSGEATGKDSMLIVIAKAASAVAGGFWYLVAPFVGMLGAFISGSNTVSDIMFGPFQFETAARSDLSKTVTLALQAVGGAAGNMICVHNVVAVLTTVGLIGKEGRVIRENLPVALVYGILAGMLAWLIAALFLPGIY